MERMCEEGSDGGNRVLNADGRSARGEAESKAAARAGATKGSKAASSQKWPDAATKYSLQPRPHTGQSAIKTRQLAAVRLSRSARSIQQASERSLKARTVARKCICAGMVDGFYLCNA